MARHEYRSFFVGVSRLETALDGTALSGDVWYPDGTLLANRMNEGMPRLAAELGPGWRLHSVIPLAAGRGQHQTDATNGWGLGFGFSFTDGLLLVYEREVDS